MIGYITLGTNDLQKSAAFYDELLAEFGARRIMDSEAFVAWSARKDQTAFSITKPYDGNPATQGNGTMTAFNVDSPEKVQAIYAKAIELGATDEGKPGPRSDSFYAGYFRDLEGNKLNVFCMTE